MKIKKQKWYNYKQGNLKFTGPVNLRLNGDFEGDLEARGVLIIGEKANVKAKTVKGV